jgi:hypothetical protein
VLKADDPADKLFKKIKDKLKSIAGGSDTEYITTNKGLLLKSTGDTVDLNLLIGKDINIPENILPYLDFFQEKYDLESIEQKDLLLIGEEIYQVPKIREESFGKKMLFKITLENNIDSIVKNLHKLIEIYLPNLNFDLLRNVPFFDLYGIWLNLSNQYKELIELEEKLLKFTPEPAQVMAGISNFAEFGDFNTIDMIAKDYHYTHEQVENLEYSLVFIILRKQIVSDNFAKSYRIASKTFNQE